MLSFIQFILEGRVNVNMNHRDLTRHLVSNGWSLARQDGGHDVYRHPEADHRIAVPRHRGDLASGTVRQILKDADVSRPKQM